MTSRAAPIGPNLPSKIASVTEVSSRVHPLYQFDRGDYTLTPGGRELQQLRKALNEDPTQPPPVPRAGREPKLALREWTVLLGAATPAERKIFLSRAARGQIKIERQG